MSVVVVVICASCTGYDVCKSLFAKFFFFQKEFFGESILFWHQNMDFEIFLTVILRDLVKLSLSFKTKT